MTTEALDSYRDDGHLGAGKRQSWKTFPGSKQPISEPGKSLPACLFATGRVSDSERWIQARSGSSRWPSPAGAGL